MNCTNASRPERVCGSTGSGMSGVLVLAAIVCSRRFLPLCWRIAASRALASSPLSGGFDTLPARKSVLSKKARSAFFRRIAGHLLVALACSERVSASTPIPKFVRRPDPSSGPRQLSCRTTTFVTGAGSEHRRRSSVYPVDCTRNEMLTAESVSAYGLQLKTGGQAVAGFKCHRLVRAGPLCVAQPRHIARSARDRRGRYTKRCELRFLRTSRRACPPGHPTSTRWRRLQCGRR